ncbi:crAss001_48 related protein [Intestinibacter bartlettii]|uniref:crAss001_48 related protein n=1 Tax=Intestinibacter bartlettii TaxID=261299 RepID=UPI0008232C5F|nr:hypothetical protein [Intestinibacter bartlettii]SCI51752.1 Uncharacterised protein [uncultured Clostridium sp.]
MKLQDTVDLMLGTDFKDRFKAEYYQLDNRITGLQNMLDKYKAGTLEFTPNCTYEMLYEQLVYMELYRVILEERAKIENIEL